MGDTIYGMRTLAIAVAIAACSSDPTLHVTVVHTTEVKVTSTTVSVYDSKNFGCQEIEYADVDASALASALVAEETLDDSGKVTAGSLANLPRSDDKTIVARGYNDAMQLVAAGCADKGVVSGADKVEVDTVPAAVVSIGIADASGADFYGIATTVTDVNGKAIDGRQVWWRVYGPGGFTPNSQAPNLDVVQNGYWEPMQPTCTKKGTATIHPVPPDLIGGFAIEVHVSWAADPPQQFTSFTKFGDVTDTAPPGSVLALNPPAAVNNSGVCTRRVTGGNATLTCLDGASTVAAYDVSVTYMPATGTATLAEGSSVAVPQTTISLFGVDNGSARDVYAAGSDCSVTALYGAPAGKSGTCSGADDVRYVPACGSAHPLVLFHIPKSTVPGSVIAVDQVTGTSAVVPVAYHAVTATPENDVVFNAVGCVTELDPTGGPPATKQMIVLDYEIVGALSTVITGTRAIYNCSGSCTPLPLPIPGGAVGFLVDGTESRLVVPTIDATGIELSQIVLLSDASTDKLVERERHPAASVPDLLVSGSFDNDSGTDLLWTFTVKRSGTAFEVSYARMVGDERLTALSGAISSTIAQMIAGDVTNDKHDDITVVSQILNKRYVATVPLQEPPPPFMLTTDGTCAP